MKRLKTNKHGLKRINIEYDNNIIFIGSGCPGWWNDKHASYDGGLVCHHVVLQQKEIQNFQNSLAVGTSVVTGGGIYGTVKKIDLAANIIEVEIAKGVVIRLDKGYVFKDMASTPVQTK